MDANFKKLIESVISNNTEDTGVNNDDLLIYYNLLYCYIVEFLKGRRYEIYFNGKVMERKYNVDICSFISLMEIEEQMLDMGFDLNYSFYEMNDCKNENFNKAYQDFVHQTYIYKMNIFRDENIKKLRNLNNTAKNLLLDYFAAQQG